MADDKVQLDVELKRLSDLEKVPKLLEAATKAAKALTDQFAAISSKVVDLSSTANATGKDLQRMVSGTKNLSVARLARERQTTPADNQKDLSLQIEAQKIRYSEAYLKNQTLIGAAQASNARTVQKELDALNNLLSVKQESLTLDKQAQQITQRALTLQEQLNKSVSQYRVARQAGKSGSVTSIDDQLNRAGLLVDKQRLIVEQTRLTANGEYTAQLAAQEARLAKLLGMQKEIQNTKSNQPRVVRPVDLGSLFKLQAELMINYGLLNQLFNLFHFGTSYVVEYDKALKDLAAITQTTNTVTEELSKTFIDVSQSTKFSAVEIAKAAVVMGQAGFSAQQIQDSIKSVVLLATATGSDLSSSVDIATSAITVFNLNAGEMAHVADVMTGALNLSKLTMDKLALGIQYAGNTAAEAGIGLEEFVSVLGGIANAGIKSGSTIGTGFQQLLVELQKPTTKLVAQLKLVGLTMADVDVRANGFTNVMETLAAAGFNSANALAAFDLRGAKAYLSISRNIDAIKEMRSQVVLSNAAAEANAKQMESLANSSDRLRNIIGATILSMSGPLEKSLVSIVNLTGTLIQNLNEMPKTLAVIGTLLAAFLSATILVKLYQIVGGFTLLTSAISAVGVAIKAVFTGQVLAGIGSLLLNPVIAITAAIAALIAVVVGGRAVFDSFGKSGGKTFDELQADADKAKGAFDKTQQTIESVGSEIDILTTKYAAYKANSGDVKNEVIAMQLRFGELSNKIRTDTITSVDELIAVLRELQGELDKTATKQLQNSITTSSAIARAHIAKTADKFSKAQLPTSKYANPSSMYDDSTIETDSPTANSAINSIIQKARDVNLGDSSLTQIKEHQAQLLTADGLLRTQISEYSKKAEELIAQRKDATEEQQTINKLTDLLTDVDASINDSNIIYNQKKQEVIQNIMSSDPFKEATNKLDEYNKELSVAKKAEGDAKTPEAKAKAKLLGESIKAKIDEFWAEFKKGIDSVQVQEIVKQLNEQNPNSPVDPKDVAAAVENKLGNKAADAASRANGTTPPNAAINFYDKWAELTKLKITEMERQIKHSTDLVNAKISNIDAVISESTDIEHGGMAGKYSDQTLFDLAQKKKDLQTEALAEQIRQYDELNPKVAELVQHEQELMDKAQKAYNASVGGKGEGEKLKELVQTTRDYNDAKDKQTDLINKSTEAQQKYNAATGQTIVEQASITDQIGEAITQYGRQMEIQNSLSGNIRKNVINVMDTATSSFSTFVTNIATGTKSVGASFREMAQNIIKSMMDIAARAAASSIMNGIFGAILGAVGGAAAGATVQAAPIQGLGQITVTDLPAPAMMVGGSVRRFATGGGVSTRDSVNALLRPGEFVLRNSAVDMIGRENLERLNSAGNSRTSESAGGVAKAAAANSNEQQLGTPVNVYVVSPDAKPVLTKGDIIATISDDISRGGPTIKLIKTVIGGRT